MSYKEFYPKIATFVVGLLLIVLLSSCGTQTSAPAQQSPDLAATLTATNYVNVDQFGNPLPTITLFDPISHAREIENNQAMVIATITAEAQLYINTQVAAGRAQAQATQAALQLTQSIETFNQQSTQQAVSMAATSTAVNVAIVERQAVMTQTAVSMAVDQTGLTQAAVLVDQERLDTERRVGEERIDARARDREDGLVGIFTIALSITGVILAVAAAVALYRLIMVRVRISERRAEEAPILLSNGMLVHKGQLVMPAGVPQALPSPGDDRARLLAAIKNKNRVANDEYRDTQRERNLRTAWRESARRFLRWSEYTVNDKQIGFSRRAMMKATGCTQDEHAAMMSFLAELGLIEKENPNRHNSPYVLARDTNGDVQNVSAVIRATVWLTSFSLPTATLPNFTPPPERNPTRQTTPHQSQITTNHQENGGERVVEGDKKTFYNELSPPPMSYEQMVEEVEEHEKRQTSEDGE